MRKQQLDRLLKETEEFWRSRQIPEKGCKEELIEFFAEKNQLFRDNEKFSKLRLCKDIELPKIIPFPIRKPPIRTTEVLQIETPESEELAISQKRKRKFKFEYEAFRKISTKFVAKSFLRQTDLKTEIGVNYRREEEGLRKIMEEKRPLDARGVRGNGSLTMKTDGDIGIPLNKKLNKDAPENKNMIQEKSTVEEEDGIAGLRRKWKGKEDYRRREFRSLDWKDNRILDEKSNIYPEALTKWRNDDEYSCRLGTSTEWRTKGSQIDYETLLRRLRKIKKEKPDTFCKLIRGWDKIGKNPEQAFYFKIKKRIEEGITQKHQLY